ncbi:hypothetical protein ACH4UR_02865 [Streptomyces lydicus]|uniref:hypothetical protein n=1 Tax=Streptomyces lydicus TaxID=47763 RepID=UPI00340B2739
MGIESDQLVFDYLSRVGDLAQQRGLPAATRMRLVTGLRARIDGQQADSVSGVKKLLAQLGTPEAVVAEAGGAPPPGEPSRPAAPPPRRASARDRLSGLARRTGLTGSPAAPGESATGRGAVPAPRGGDPAPPAPAVPAAGLPPHLAGADELGDAQDAPDWWRVEPAPFGPGETVPGFVGGIEIPEIWERPESDGDGDGGKDGEAAGDEGPGAGAAGRRGRLSLRKNGGPAAAGDAAGAPADAAAGGARPLPKSLRRALTRRRPAAAAPPPADAGGAAAQDGTPGEAVRGVPLWAWLSPVPTLAVLLLVAGAVLGSWLALAGGWALAYVSRRLTRTETKFAALGVPGTAVGALVVWMWGRFDGRWGEPLAQGRLGPELLAALPATARVAAVASALYLLWRMRRAAR